MVYPVVICSKYQSRIWPFFKHGSRFPILQDQSVLATSNQSYLSRLNRKAGSESTRGLYMRQLGFHDIQHLQDEYTPPLICYLEMLASAAFINSSAKYMIHMIQSHRFFFCQFSFEGLAMDSRSGLSFPLYSAS